MTFRDEFRRYQLAQWEGVRNMLREKQLQDLAELVGEPEDWLACQAFQHLDQPAHRATHWALWSCGCDVLLCAERAKYVLEIEKESAEKSANIYCPRCRTNNNRLVRLVPLTP